MKKKLAAQSVFFVLFIFFFVGCASTPRQEIMTEPDPNAQGAGAVPGEKVSDDGGLAPGATGTNPSVRW